MTAHVDTTAPKELHRVVRLLQLNLALSALLALLFAAFHSSLLDFQIRRMALPPGTDVTPVRSALSAALWSRVITVVIVAVVYVVLIRSLRAGRRRAYLRVLVLSVISLLAILYLALSGQYPVWVVAEQVVQALVLAALLWAVTRPEVRAFFAKRA